MSAAPMNNPDEARRAQANDAVAAFLAEQERKSFLRFLTCGSVDDGKSTLIGRLLWDAADLPDDTRAAIEHGIGPDGLPDLSLLVDGLAAEREQGITIDIAWRYFDAGRRRFVIIDSPGHEQFTRNMATGASHADVAIMLIDARHGVKNQTRRHAAILSLMGVRRVVLAVNKMDLVAWSESKFADIRRDFDELAARFNFDQAVAIPLAAKPGDNVARPSSMMPWYDGPHLLAHLSRLANRRTSRDEAFRFPVQLVVRDGRDFRGLAGTVTSGSIKPGDDVLDHASGVSSRVRRIVAMDGDRDMAAQGDAVVLELADEVDLSRGAVLSRAEDPPKRGRAIRARLIWLADTNLDTDHGLLLRTSTDLVPVAAITVRSRLDLATLTETDATICQPNDVLVADIAVGRSVAIDLFASRTGLGHFVLVDALSGATLAGGVVEEIDEAGRLGARRSFALTREVLASELCAGLDPADHEFRRRAKAVVALMEAAGIAVDYERT